ncbi:hypothetical protein LOAG_02897 [Loa loa]|uniref:Uncharacterized protein n=1 Tax=Loa loa TaxID=7209 RepID=A0A1S0U646_LOALO|nr:hypothetical protein LOAG_02897 [Loa loa]EFO25589.1 hypothetical protein LOAG_02897 [Loa loa]
MQSNFHCSEYRVHMYRVRYVCTYILNDQRKFSLAIIANIIRGKKWSNNRDLKKTARFYEEELLFCEELRKKHELYDNESVITSNQLKVTGSTKNKMLSTTDSEHNCEDYHLFSPNDHFQLPPRTLLSQPDQEDRSFRCVPVIIKQTIRMISY